MWVTLSLPSRQWLVVETLPPPVADNNPRIHYTYHQILALICAVLTNQRMPRPRPLFWTSTQLNQRDRLSQWNNEDKYIIKRTCLVTSWSFSICLPKTSGFRKACTCLIHPGWHLAHTSLHTNRCSLCKFWMNGNTLCVFYLIVEVKRDNTHRTVPHITHIMNYYKMREDLE